MASDVQSVGQRTYITGIALAKQLPSGSV